MICRKIIYRGFLNTASLNTIYDIARNIEITGEIKRYSDDEIHLLLEGDPSFVKLLQHQVEHSLGSSIISKSVETLPFKNYKGLTLAP